MRVVLVAALLVLSAVAFAPVATIASAEHPCYEGEPCPGHGSCVPKPKPLAGWVCLP